MPGVTRDGDATTTGHGCNTTTTVTGPSTDVFCKDMTPHKLMKVKKVQKYLRT